MSTPKKAAPKRVRSQTTKYVHVDNDLLPRIAKAAKADDRSEAYVLNKVIRYGLDVLKL